jgi:hypothetical protein
LELLYYSSFPNYSSLPVVSTVRNRKQVRIDGKGLAHDERSSF